MKNISNIISLSRAYLNENSVYLCLLSTVCLCALYFFLRFQFGLTWDVLVVLYASVGYLIIHLFLSLIGDVRSVKYLVRNKLDLAFLLFFLHNAVFVPLTFYRYGRLEGLYAAKNYLVPLAVYFVVVYFLRHRDASRVIGWVLLCSVLVSGIYVAEMASVRYAPLEVKAPVEDAFGVFKYTRAMDLYAKEKQAECRGVTKSWTKSDRSLYIRLPGPAGHSNATAFVIAIGTVLAFAAVVFGPATWHRGIGLFLCAIGLFWGCSRTNMIGAGLAILALLGLGLWTGNVRRRDALLLVVAVPSVILLLVLFQVIDWKAYQQIFNLKQTYYTLTATIDKETVRELVVLKGSNPASFVWGSGIAPILSDTYSSGLYLGQTIASDDAFYLQVLSQYGIVCVAMYIGLMVIGLKGAIGSFYRNDPEYVRKYEYVPFGLIGLIVLGMINIFHGASLIKPHVSMIFYVSIGCMSVILSRRGSEDAEREALDAGRTGVRARLLRVDP
ncbi:MAG: hypothetical protein A4E60_00461 [Syntrophorhabdus sp. PtaB.Bin047]|nr:MAG: hypothetical protein A4E60_00461 [Syntrophorhabdus sp. PtaB.Bin047]